MKTPGAGATAMSWLHASHPVGQLLRLPLDLIPKGTVVPILATAARGKRWIVGSGPHGCWLGFNEIRKRRRFARVIRSGSVIYDIGANVGSYAILGSVLVGPHGRVVAFEPLPENVRFLKQHIGINGLGNVDVMEVAVGERTGPARFQRHADRLQGRIDPEGGDAVAMVALDDVVAEGRASPPDCLKIDVEGGEAAVLRGAAEVLRTLRPTVFLATHGSAVREECLDLLAAAGYGVAEIGRGGDEWVASPRRPAPVGSPREDPTEVRR